MTSAFVRDLPLIAWYVGVLAFLEGLLSADNALVLAVMVRHLSRHDRRRVLQWGIWGAIGFRVIAVLLSTILLKLWYFKVIGGLYLLYLAFSHFWSRGRSSSESAKPESKARAWLHGFWGTVASVTVADIVFSIDSIFAAVAMADDFPFEDTGKLFIVLTGGVLGIITMRFVVRYFVSMLDRFPGLAEGAYFLVAWIGLKLMISGFFEEKFHIPEWLFWSVMILIMILSFVIKPKGPSPETTEASDNLDLLETEEEPGEDSQDERAPPDGAGRPGPPEPGPPGPVGSRGDDPGAADHPASGNI